MSSTTTTTSADFVVFGLGRHACPGRFFAFHELKCTISHLVRNFEISFENSKVTLLSLINVTPSCSSLVSSSPSLCCTSELTLSVYL